MFRRMCKGKDHIQPRRQRKRLMTADSYLGDLLRCAQKTIKHGDDSPFSLEELMSDSRSNNEPLLSPREECALVRCLTAMGCTVVYTPLCADFGFSYQENVSVWEYKSRCCPPDRLKQLLLALPPCRILTTENFEAVCNSMQCHIYTCPPRNLGSSNTCTVYPPCATKRTLQSVYEKVQLRNSIWEANKAGSSSNTCVGPSIIRLRTDRFADTRISQCSSRQEPRINSNRQLCLT